MDNDPHNSGRTNAIVGIIILFIPTFVKVSKRLWYLENGYLVFFFLKNTIIMNEFIKRSN
ncbi:hypothetical protein [Enterococcus mundtii]|uniref:hypothetical protein n=1 Tax=Enterococcus mundtii TaxID=53346 RepID=UPI000A35504D|nr:hypothetical protein [Enterococcus mundtii]